MNWENLCPNLSFTVENNLHKIRLFTFETKHVKNEIFHYMQFKNLSKNWKKYVFQWKKLNFEHIENSLHTTEFLALLGKVLNICISYSMFTFSNDFVMNRELNFSVTRMTLGMYLSACG